MATQPLPLPSTSGNSTLDAINSLPVPAKQALFQAHQNIVGQHLQDAQAQQPAPTGQIAPPSNVPTLGAAPQMPSSMVSPSLPSAGAVAPRPLTDEAQGHHDEMNRLEDSKSGIGQIHNAWGRVPLQILDAVGATFAPRLEQALPGTEGHHNYLVNVARGNVAEDTAQQKAQDDAAFKQAQTENEQAMPELNREKLENTQLKTDAANDLNNRRLGEKTANDQAKIDAAQQAKGFKKAADGTWDLDPNSEQGKKIQAQTNYIDAKNKLAEAQTEYEKTKNDPNSQANQKWKAEMQVQQQRIAQNGAALGMRREALTFNENKYDNPNPSASEINKGDLANSMRLQIHTMQDIANRHPEFFGPGAGNLNRFKVWLGSQDPEAQQFVAAQHVMGEHAAGLFGSRSFPVVKDIQNLGRMNMNLDALNASLGQLDKTAEEFQNASTQRHHFGNAHQAPQTSQGGRTQHFEVNGQGYDIPADKVAAFKKAKGLQ